MTDHLTHLRSAVSKDGAALLDTDRGTLTTLNETGAFVWQKLERGESEDAIVADLTAATGESIEAVTSDVRGFIAELSAHGLTVR